MQGETGESVVPDIVRLSLLLIPATISGYYFLVTESMQHLPLDYHKYPHVFMPFVMLRGCMGFSIFDVVED